MKELLAHLVGDYITQNSWEASNKTNRWLPAVTHATKYTLGFLPLTRKWKALAVIGGTHAVLDHHRVAVPLVWAKNQVGVPASERYPFSRDNAGYSPETPVWLATWLMIIADNTLHMTINHWALNKYK